MKIKLLKNFKSCRVSLKEGQVIVSPLVEQMDQTYGLKNLVDLGIIEIIEETPSEVPTEEVNDAPVETIEELPSEQTNDTEELPSETKKVSKKKGKK